MQKQLTAEEDSSCEEVDDISSGKEFPSHEEDRLSSEEYPSFQDDQSSSEGCQACKEEDQPAAVMQETDPTEWQKSYLLSGDGHELYLVYRQKGEPLDSIVRNVRQILM